jgi:hypothetical protein
LLFEFREGQGSLMASVAGRREKARKKKFAQRRPVVHFAALAENQGKSINLTSRAWRTALVAAAYRAAMKTSTHGAVEASHAGVEPADSAAAVGTLSAGGSNHAAAGDGTVAVDAVAVPGMRVPAV